MPSFAQTYGLVRSVLTYYGIPGRIRRLTNFYRRFVKPGELCFDIGAHVGNHTLAMRRAGGRIVAVEPQPGMAAFLQRWFGRDPDVILYRHALGGAPGEASLQVSSKTPTVSTLSDAWRNSVQTDPSFSWVRWDDRVEVPVTTLDHLIKIHGLPAFCKIDVEGYEGEVLRGLSHPIPAISFEMVPAAKGIALECLSRIQSLGDYRYGFLPGETVEISRWNAYGEIVSRVSKLSTTDRSGNIIAALSHF